MAKNRSRDERLRAASRERREEERQEVRDAILSAAGELFLERGYRGFSLREIAERIGYSPGTIYLYFKNRDDILFSIAEQGYQRFDDAIREAALTTDDPLDRLGTMGQAYVQFGLSHPAHYRLMFIERTDFLDRSEDEGRLTWQATYNVLLENVAQAIQAGHTDGSGAERICDTMWATMHGVVSLAISIDSLDTDRVQAMIDVAFDMIGETVLRP